MFGRLKQRVKEKTGRAKATALPENVAIAADYFKNHQGRLKTLQQSFQDICDMFDDPKRNEMRDFLQKLSHANGKMNLNGAIGALENRAQLDKNAHLKILGEMEKLKTFMNIDCKSQSELSSNLNTCRLNMDAAASNFDEHVTDSNKIKKECTARDFEAMCTKVIDNYKQASADEEMLSKSVEAIIAAVKGSFK